MLKKLKPKSEFSRNVLTLMTGTTIAQAVPIAISPILTRIYTPKDFGVFALYMSVASILSVVATGRYELAIMLPKKDEDAINIVALSIIISFFVSFISFLIVFIFNAQITNLLGNPEISNWLYFIPITVLLTGIYQSFNYWSNRKKQYKRLATSRVIQSGTTASTNLAMGFKGFGSSGLILGNLFGQGVATTVLGRMIWKEDKNRLSSLKKLKIFALIKKYINQLKFVLATSLLDIISLKIPIFAISFIFKNSTTLGFYTLVDRTLSVPFSIIGGAVGQNFYQEFSSKVNNKNNKEAKLLLVKIWIYLFLIGIVPAIIIFIYGPEIFSFIFGTEWKDAGAMASILIWMYLFSFISSPTSSAYIVLGLQNIGLYFGFIVMLYRALIFIFTDNIISAFSILVLCEIIQILVYNFIIWRKI